MRLKFLLRISVAMVLLIPAVQTKELIRPEEFRVGPVYEDRPGAVSVVVELPYGVTKPDPGSFRLLIQDKVIATAQDAKTFLNSGHELGLLVCIDVSGTMAGSPLDDTKKALYSFLSDRQGIRISVMPFGTEIGRPLLNFKTTEPTSITDAIDSLKAEGPRGRTRLYQALYDALDYYETLNSSMAPARRRILVISDGKDEGSSASSDNVIKRARALGIPIDAVARGKIVDQFIESLRYLANGTGGRFVHAQPGVVSTQDALQRIYRELMETQTVVVSFTYPARPESGLTEDVAIELQRSGTVALRERLGAKIALPDPPATPAQAAPISPPINKLWIWVSFVLLVLLLISLIAVLFARRRPKVSDEQSEISDKPPQMDDGLKTRDSPSAVSAWAISRNERRTQVDTHEGSDFLPPTPEHPSAILVCISGPLEGRQFALVASALYIGADPENDLVIVDDEYLSGRHACLRYDRGTLFLVDQDSRNGTFLNDNRLKNTARRVNAGDQVTVGQSTFKVLQGPGR